MQKWEYAHLFIGDGAMPERVRFSHREDWTGIRSDLEVMRRLGDEGWEMVTHSFNGSFNDWWFKRPQL